MIGTNERTRPLEWGRVNPWALAAVLVGTVDVVMWWLGLRQGMYWPPQGGDLIAYRDAAASWLAGGPFYHPYQLAPYEVWGQKTVAGMPVLYPPSAIPLFAAFTVLPGLLWWAIPLGILGWRLRQMDRSRLLLVAALVAWPQTIVLLWTGNPLLWMAAFLAVGLSPLVLLKPTLAPFALLGFGRRRWWVGLVALGILSLAFLPLWSEYVAVLLNAREGGLFYLFANVPLMLVGALLWHGRAERNRERGQDRRRSRSLDGHVDR